MQLEELSFEERILDKKKLTDWLMTSSYKDITNNHSIVQRSWLEIGKRKWLLREW